MALEGTIRDFSLADIFQLIGLQRKTGVLSLAGPEDTVSISFEKGRIVGAESEARRIEDRLGHVLIKTGKVQQQQLERVLRLQKETGQRVGDLLISEAALAPEDLGRALELQVTQIIYRLFRWADGEFRFAQTSSVDYDRQCFRPIAVENVLMEGLRILDEWPLIERRVRSFTLVYAPSDRSREVREEGAGTDEATDLELDAALGIDGAELPPEERHAEPENDLVTVSAKQAVVYGLLDGRLSVQDVIDRSGLGEFESCRALYELLEKDLIQEVTPGVPAGAPPRPSRGIADRATAVVAVLLVTGVLLGGLWWTLDSPFSRLLGPFRVLEATESLRLSASLSRLSRLEFALRLFTLYRGAYPESLDDLVAMGLVSEDDLMDPWGQSYTYLVSRRSYQLRGLDGQGRERSDLILTGRLLRDSQDDPATPAPRASR
jgi:hypothetical protein